MPDCYSSGALDKTHRLPRAALSPSSKLPEKLSMSFRLLLPAPFLQAIVDQARAELPNECCGLLAGVFEEDGKVGRVVKRYPLLNDLASSTEFCAEPKGQLAAHKEMDRERLELLAVYHSHPTSAPVPSRKDRERSIDANVMALIVSLRGDQPEIAAWWLTEKTHAPADWSEASGVVK